MKNCLFEYKRGTLAMGKVRAISLIIAILLCIPACQDMGKNNIVSLPLSTALVVENGSKSQSNDETNYDFIIDPKYDQCDMPVDGMIGIQKTDGENIKYGFVDTEGRVIADAIYDETRYYRGASSASSGFSQGLAPVKKNDKWGYIDMTGKNI